MEQISAMAKAMFQLNFESRKVDPWEIKGEQLMIVPGSGSIEPAEKFGDV